jgi:membrane protease YdiL (CAAX protease family)
MKTRMLDWFMATMAVAIIAWMMAAQTTSQGTPSVNVLDIRQLELQPRLWAAQEELPSSVRASIGLTNSGPDDEAQPEDPLASVEAIASEVGAQVEAQYAWSVAMRTIGAAITIALGEDETGLRLLYPLTSDTDLEKTERDVILGLLQIAKGHKAAPIHRVNAHLKVLGTSEWLRKRLQERHLRNTGDKAQADQLGTDAADMNIGYVGAMAATVLLTGALALLGMLLLLLFPWLSGVLRRRGHTGLAGTCSPFETGHTFRVLAAWFLFYACSHTVFGLLMTLLGPPGANQVFSIAAVSLLHGGASIVLIQTFGRKEHDSRSLGECLRFRFSDASGGIFAFFLWVVMGLAVTLAVALVAVVVNEQILGDELTQQSSVQLFAESRSTSDLLIMLTAVCVFAPVFEEILFRGFLYRNLRDRFGPWLGLCFSSFLFAIAHVDMSNLLPLFAIGLAFGYSYERSGSLWVPVLIHALWNFSTLARILSLMGS